jgi:hypothetical protein
MAESGAPQAIETVARVLSESNRAETEQLGHRLAVWITYRYVAYDKLPPLEQHLLRQYEEQFREPLSLSMARRALDSTLNGIYQEYFGPDSD